MGAVRPDEVSKALKTALNVAPIISTHTVSTTLGFWNNTVAPTATAPYVRWVLLGSEDLETLGARIATRFDYLVEAVTNTDYDLAADIADAIDTILQRGTLTITGGTHDVTYRTGVMERQTMGENGELYHHVGGFYSIHVQL